jgi:hypothetical protein
MTGRPKTYRGRSGFTVSFGRRGRMSRVFVQHGYEILLLRMAKRLGDHNGALLTMLWTHKESK